MPRILLALACLSSIASLAAADRQLILEQPMCAGISGLRPFWDRPVVLTESGTVREGARGKSMVAPMAIWGAELAWHGGHQQWMDVIDVKFKPKPVDSTPGAIAFDAVHRSLLVRFPGLAQRIADELAAGGRIAKVELVLPFRAYEKLSHGYREPSSFIGRGWDEVEPRWHAQAWRLRRAWSADPLRGPTFNGPLHGVASWTRFGASDERSDRFPAVFGPSEVSATASEAIDLTACLVEPAYGADLAARLRSFEDCGVLVRKQESYDMHFETPQYEWGTMTGGRGILVRTPKLVVTLADGPAQRLTVLPPADPAAGATWEPTAVLPDEAGFAALRERFAPRRPSWMPEWQWQRLEELRALDAKHGGFPATRMEYLRWVDDILRTPPRTWVGFGASEQLGTVATYLEAFPGPVVEQLQRYWSSWLLPHRDNADIVHNQYHQIWKPWRKIGSDYVDATADWRGNRSFYRESYNTIMSTMNYNHTSALGALLGGHFIGSEKAMADGRFGLEMFPLRLWAWYDGTTQESIDHYYFSHTLTAQKMFVDFAPTPFDRMIGESILAKSVEELAACFHPDVKRFVSTSGRTGIGYALAIHEGVGFIVHSLSRQGTLTDLGAKDIAGIPILGHDFPAGRVAEQALPSSWGPEWASDLIDAKPLPFEMTATFKQWGSYRDPVKWKKSWLGQHYGVASFDCSMGTLQQMAIWNRSAKPAVSATDIGLLTVRFGFNRTNMLDTLHHNKEGKPNANGILGEQGGDTACLQHRGTMLLLGSPFDQLASSADLKPTAQPITSIQTTVLLSTLQEQPTWSLHVDGKPLDSLPAKLPASSRIVVRDGDVFLGLVPIPATALGARDAEVLIRVGDQPVKMQGGGELREKLLIENLHYRSDTPFDLASAAPGAIDAASGGFVIVVSDASEGDFFAFQRRIAAGALSDSWDAATKVRTLGWKDGADHLQAGFLPAHPTSPAPEQVFASRMVNGAWPYLAPGMERDTTVSAMGRTGTLEKNGSILRHQPGTMGYLLAMPGQGAIRFANPLPDLAWQRFTGPQGLSVEADGQVGILTVDLDPRTRRLEVKHAVAPGVAGPGLATVLLVAGFDPASLTVNRRTIAPPHATVQVDGRSLLVVPLAEAPPDLASLPARVVAARARAGTAFAATTTTDQPAMRCEPGGEGYLLTLPRPGTARFHRQWHSGTSFVATMPGGPTVSADGRVGLRSLVIDAQANAVEIDAPRYYQEATTDSMRISGKASCLVITAAAREPTISLNGAVVKARSLDLPGGTGWIVPLPGGEALRDDAGIRAGLAECDARATRR